MVKKSKKTAATKSSQQSPAARVPMAAIRHFARQVADRFQPDKILLFGSSAYGQPYKESDVDILVVMPAANEIDQSIRIWQAIDPPFPLDLLVRTPKNLRWRLEEGDWFLREVMAKGKVLYEKTDKAVGAKSGSRLRARPISRASSTKTE